MTRRADRLVTRCCIALAPLFAACVPAHASTGQSGRSPAQSTADTGAALRERPLAAEQRRQFVGTYSVTMPGGERTLLYVTDKGGALFARSGNQEETRRMLYRGDGVFATEGMSDFVFRFVIEGGRATKFIVSKEDGTVEGVRIE